MATATLTDPRAWRADTIDDQERWYYPLSERALSALDRSVRDSRGRPITELQASEELRHACAEDMAPVLAALETGRGFAIITAGQPGHYAPNDLQAAYWLVGQLLGRPMEQNVEGILLYDVRDTGKDVRYGARFSVTSAETSFHTDNSFGSEVLDYVGLLCVHPAKSGGQSQLVSGYSIVQELSAHHEAELEILRQPFHIERRGGLRPGEEPIVRYPILGSDGPELLIRYLRYWIEVGHEKAGCPLTARQMNALDTLDAVAGERRMRVEFDMRAGDMFFINNRWLLHNRTSFEDHPEPERRRHCVRLWLRREVSPLPLRERGRG